MAEAPSSRNVPLPIQRAVRQRCGFGCVVCGMPLYEYEHLLGWANVHRHVAAEITLLCDQHHRERTSGLLPIEAVHQADADPHNLREGVSKPYSLYYEGESCEVLIGNSSFTTRDEGYGTLMVPISVDSTPLIGFILADGHLLLNLNLFDESNNCIMRIVNNQLSYSSDPWDIQLVGRNLKVRAGHRRLLVDMTFDPPNRVRLNQGRLLRNGVEILVRPGYVLITNNCMLVSGMTAVNCAYGLKIGPHLDDLGAAMAIESIPRYLGDTKAAIRWAREAMREAP
jgi:trigger factor